MASETLIKQQTFTLLIGRLIDYCYREKGWKMTFGEAYRTPEQAAINAKKGIGIANSLHTQRLAIDMNLFKDGKLCMNSEDFKELGEYWEGLSTPDAICTWGGRFSKPDGNHFSITHNGIK